MSLSVAQLSPDDVLASLGSGRNGVSDSEAGRRHAEFGPNRVEAVTHPSPWLSLLREFSHFFALILWLAAGLAFLAESLHAGEGMRELGFAMIGVIVINGVFSFWQTYRAERALAALRSLLPRRVNVVRDGQTRMVDAMDIVPGDLLLLTEGSQVPADCRIVETWGLRVNLATLTGESRPMARRAESDVATDPLRARNLLFAGTLIVSGQARAVVYAIGMRTEFGRLARLTQTAGDVESPLQREIRRVSKLVAILALGLGAVFFAIGDLVVGVPFWSNFMLAIGVIVANVPEGLLPTVTLALAMATQRMAKRNALVRHLPAIETLGSATVILTDKTGTLTQNCMTVRERFIHHADLPTSERLTTKDPEAKLRAVARHCHSLEFLSGRPVGDPVELALWEFSGHGPTEERISEIPFDADRRRMSVVTRDIHGRRSLWCKGAPETVGPLCAYWLDGDLARPMAEADRAVFRQAQEDMADRGLRVLALAWRPLSNDDAGEEAELQLCGLVGLEDPPRPDVRQAVTRCHEAGVRMIMITGDHPRTALALAREIGMVMGPAPMVVLGEQARQMSPAQLQLTLNAPEILFARVTAEQKMLVVQALQHKGDIVAVTGDGVNDAPALKTADIGIAMGLSGTDVAREAADIVLLDDHFATIVNAIEEGRTVFENIRKFVTYIFTHNFAELIPFLAFVLFRIPLPLTAIQILAIDLGTDTVPALALGAEPPAANVMRRPPRPRNEHLLTWRMFAHAYAFLGPLEAVAAMAAFFFVLDQAGWRYGETLAHTDTTYLAATTACFAAIVITQLVNLFVSRHPQLPFWRLPLKDNPLLGISLVCALGLLGVIVYTSWGQRLFATAPLGLDVWSFILPFALGLGVAEEIRKKLVSSWN
ncbi:calcium-transporting ATPase 1 [mine drainage metagenome]|uniref:Calcium-transporting ATPase 1 n=1 Tax=mine drainage metagenome TaxID=410659 RepID=A0A1J5QZL0_9ZZZZ